MVVKQQLAYTDPSARTPNAAREDELFGKHVLITSHDD
jgi:hypothetical protein